MYERSKSYIYCYDNPDFHEMSERQLIWLYDSCSTLSGNEMAYAYRLSSQYQGVVVHFEEFGGCDAKRVDS